LSTQTVSTETTRIADELRRASEGEAWHGPAIEDNLKGLTAQEAAARPIAGAHSIWEIVHHLTAWAVEVGARLEGRARRLLGEDDWPPVTDTSDEAWRSAKTKLAEAHARLRVAIREFPPGRLGESVPLDPDGGAASFYLMLHGLAQHDAYHTGQVAILRKALRNVQ
jgi:hypothetical protein